jgi:hypothetical protein
MTARCKRHTDIRNVHIDGGGSFVDITLGLDTVEYTIRVATYHEEEIPVAWTLAYKIDPGNRFHFAAGESYNEARIGPMSVPLILHIGSLNAATVELIEWKT